MSVSFLTLIPCSDLSTKLHILGILHIRDPPIIRSVSCSISANISIFFIRICRY